MCSKLADVIAFQPQESIFGYKYPGSNCAPSLLIGLINMFQLKEYGKGFVDDDGKQMFQCQLNSWYPGQVRSRDIGRYNLNSHLESCLHNRPPRLPSPHLLAPRSVTPELRPVSNSCTRGTCVVEIPTIFPLPTNSST